VGGYGLDQIYLLYQRSAGLYERPFVVIGVFLEDMDRSVLSIRIGQKPYYRIVDDRLALSGLPILPSTAEYIAQNPPEIGSYLYRMLIYSAGAPWRLKAYLRGHTAKQELKEAIAAQIVREWTADLRKNGVDFVFLVFSGLRAVEGGDEWRESFFRRVLDREGVPWISASEIIQKDARLQGKLLAEYFVPVDGHPNAYQNQVVSHELKNLIRDRLASSASGEVPTLGQ
jgi:hypothetical protein